MWQFVHFRILMMVAPPFGAVLWMGVDSSDNYYEQPPSVVQSALADAKLPLHVLGGEVGGSRVWKENEGKVITALLDRNGTELMRFVTVIEPDGTGSSVTTTVDTPKGAHAERAGKAMQSQALAMNLLQKLADEHVDAAIEDRPFDMMFAAPPQAKNMMSSLPGLSAKVSRSNAMAAEMSDKLYELDADLVRQQQDAEIEMRRREVANQWKQY